MPTSNDKLTLEDIRRALETLSRPVKRPMPVYVTQWWADEWVRLYGVLPACFKVIGQDEDSTEHNSL